MHLDGFRPKNEHDIWQKTLREYKFYVNYERTTKDEEAHFNVFA